MPPAETTQAFSGPNAFTAPPESTERSERNKRARTRQTFSNVWQSQKDWVRLLITPPLTVKDGDVAAVTKIKVEEISLRRLSRTPGRVVISVTDEQAAEIKRMAQGD